MSIISAHTIHRLRTFYIKHRHNWGDYFGWYADLEHQSEVYKNMDDDLIYAHEIIEHAAYTYDPHGDYSSPDGPIRACNIILTHLQLRDIEIISQPEIDRLLCIVYTSPYYSLNVIGNLYKAASVFVDIDLTQEQDDSDLTPELLFLAKEYYSLYVMTEYGGYPFKEFTEESSSEFKLSLKSMRIFNSKLVPYIKEKNLPTLSQQEYLTEIDSLIGRLDICEED